MLHIFVLCQSHYFLAVLCRMCVFFFPIGCIKVILEEVVSTQSVLPSTVHHKASSS